MEPQPVPYADRLKALLERPGLIEEVCLHVAEGGSLIDLAQTWDIRYSDLAMWLRQDVNRAMKLAEADKEGEAWLKRALLREAQLIARVDLSKAYDEQGNLLPVHKMPEDIRRCIAAIEVDEIEQWDPDAKAKVFIGFTKKVKFWNKDKMIETLGKQVGIFNPVQKHHVSTSLEDLVAGSKDQPAA